MVTREQYEKYQKYTLDCLEQAGIALTEQENSRWKWRIWAYPALRRSA
jgi:hypothetical protein